MCAITERGGIMTDSSTGSSELDGPRLRVRYERVSGIKEPVNARTCPPAIVDTDPEGHGLGIWILVGQPSPDLCEYKYGGGIV